MTFEEMQELKGVGLLKRLLAAGGEMFVEDTGNARTCLYLESRGWAILRFEENIEIIEVTETGRKLVESIK